MRLGPIEFDNYPKLKAFLYTIDRKLAGLFKMEYGDKYTVSAQCFLSNCLFCRVFRRLFLEHTRKAAIKEQLWQPPVL